MPTAPTFSTPITTNTGPKVAVALCQHRRPGHQGQPPAVWRFLQDGLDRGRRKGEGDFGVSLLWIFDAVRQFGPGAAREVFGTAVRHMDRGVVGIGIGGDEQKGPPELFREAYAYASDRGLRLTAHAGENAGSESVWGALNLRAERIGHGLGAAQDPELVEVLAGLTAAPRHRWQPLPVVGASKALVLRALFLGYDTRGHGSGSPG